MILIKSLFAGYGNGFVLKGINISFEDNFIYAIIGPNGSGKTTLFKAILSDVPDKKGKVIISGRENLSKKQISKIISFAPAQFNDVFDFTVWEFVEMGIFVKKENFWNNQKDIQEIDDVLREMQIKEIANKKISDLSTGEKQIALLSQIILKDTRVILLDEPTSHLDLKHKKFFLKKFRKLKESGKMLLITFHNLNEALNVADRFVLLKNGKIFSITSQLKEDELSLLYETEVRIIEKQGIKAVMI